MALNNFARLFRRKDLIKIAQCHVNLLYKEKPQLVVDFVRSSHFQVDRNNLSSVALRKQYLFRCYATNTAEHVDDNEFRSEHNITTVGNNIPSPYIDIHCNEFPDYIKNYLKEQNFTKPTVIQAQGWPIALSGQNFVGIAQTGTGKTLAFLLPAVVHIKETESKKGKGPRVLVLAPTRELARQIEQVANTFTRQLNVRCVCVYGGTARQHQIKKLEAGVDILIATPGRLNDFLDSKCTTLSRCTYVVLDEADRMLDMGFEPQIRQALEGIPKERQILMFSATWPQEIQQLAKEYLGKFAQVIVGSTELSANPNITQHFYVCEDDKMSKFNELMHDFQNIKDVKMLVFANTKRFVDILTLVLRRNGWQADGIHGDRTQVQRDSIIYRFKNNKCKILVATDVAARGLDIDGITHVVNFDFPNTVEDYIHRIGRTGRSENKGVSHTLLTTEDGRIVKSLIAVLKEANQNVPAELEDLARTYKENKFKERQAVSKFKPRFNNNFGTKRFNNSFGTKKFNRFRREDKNDRYDYV